MLSSISPKKDMSLTYSVYIYFSLSATLSALAKDFYFSKTYFNVESYLLSYVYVQLVEKFSVLSNCIYVGENVAQGLLLSPMPVTFNLLQGHFI